MIGIMLLFVYSSPCSFKHERECTQIVGDVSGVVVGDTCGGSEKVRNDTNASRIGCLALSAHTVGIACLIMGQV